MRIISDDGREFGSVEECNAYEADMRLKKAKVLELTSLRKTIEEKSKDLYEAILRYDELGGKKEVELGIGLYGLSYSRFFGEWSKRFGTYLYQSIISK